MSPCQKCRAALLFNGVINCVHRAKEMVLLKSDAAEKLARKHGQGSVPCAQETGLGAGGALR